MHGDDHIAPGYCQCGCGRRTTVIRQTSRTQGRVAGQYNRFARGHQSLGSSRPGRAFDFREVGDCWLWAGSVDSRGYGRWGDDSAHRRAYRVLVDDIPDGYEIHHTCKNRACVYPGHLVAMTRSEHKAEHRAATLSRREAWRVLSAAGYSPRQIAEVFGVTAEGVRKGLGAS